MSINITYFKKGINMSKIYNFDPQDDLTVAELAKVMQVLFVSLIEGIQGQPVKGADDLQVDEIVYNAVPVEMRKHFKDSGTTVAEIPAPKS